MRACPRQKQPAQVMDGELGAYVRKEFSLKGIYVFEKIIEAGFRQMTAWSKPIKNADDFAGLKMRTPSAAIFIVTVGAACGPW